MAYRTLVGGVRGQAATLEGEEGIRQGDKGEKGSLDSRNSIAAQAHGTIRELKIVWGGWNTESKPGSVRGQGWTHT